jgi:hypothetical protein
MWLPHEPEGNSDDTYICKNFNIFLKTRLANLTSWLHTKENSKTRHDSLLRTSKFYI